MDLCGSRLGTEIEHHRETKEAREGTKGKTHMRIEAKTKQSCEGEEPKQPWMKEKTQLEEEHETTQRVKVEKQENKN